MQRNHYQVLGLRADASGPEIRAAFVRLTRLHHPDSARRDLPQRLHEVQAAYRCLSVPETRAAHDAVLAELERAHFARARCSAGSSATTGGIRTRSRGRIARTGAGGRS